MAGLFSALTEGQRAVIGECIAQASMLEGLLTSAVMWLASPGKQSDAVYRIASGESASWLVDKARMFVGDLPEDQQEPWNRWLVQASKALGERNMLAHSTWILQFDPGVTLGRKPRRHKVGVSSRVTEEDLVAIRTRLIQARVDGRKLIDTLRP